ncbi:hypothetical protein CDD81_7260 [Ophiocordyceps australis]|uniref:Uncharacterized protein n=1 Tax=Ophiocordyceps australis TaxID=1399860 RepID=A0A2C5Y4W4_9HYPO|nr:hypothetical protein CDD81_7260 [Ophiocordyceps australis]
MTPEERSSYYIGLEGCPLLVGRSSLAPFVRPVDTHWTIFKQLRAVKAHTVISKWNDYDGPTSLRGQVINLLAKHRIDWCALDILRIGWDGRDDDDDFNMVLFVSVEPGSLNWEHGCLVASQIKLLLSHHGLEDIDCEIKESRRIHLASVSSTDTAKDANIMKLERHQAYN